MSTADHERQLWEASEQFVRGEMGTEHLDQIELSDKLSRDDATSAVVFQHMRWTILIFIVLISIVIVVATLVLILLRNVSLLALIPLYSPLVYIYRIVVRYYFPKDEHAYQLQARKLKKKKRKKKKKMRTIGIV